MSSKVIVHIDLNAFFVRCEEIKDPSLKNKAAAIGHEGRAGIISTCSYEARKYGVHSGQPTFQAKKACPFLILKSVDFPFYRTKSKEFFKFVKSYTPLVEMASIDECYADFSEVFKKVKDPIAYFKEFQKQLYLKTSLYCSIGIGPSKFLAKMGSDYKKPNGLTIIRRKDIPSIIYPLPISNMFGIGKKSVPRLENIGIHTIGDLAKRIKDDTLTMQDYFGKFYDTLCLWINGYGDDNVIVESEDPKSISSSTTLIRDTDDYEIIKEALTLMSEEVSIRAKNQGVLGKCITLVVKDSEFNSYTKSFTLNNPINESYDILDIALDLYASRFTNMNLRLVGVSLSSLVDLKDIVIQMTFFDFEEHEEKNKTKLLINEFNRRLSKPMLKRCSEVEKNGN